MTAAARKVSPSFDASAARIAAIVRGELAKEIERVQQAERERLEAISARAEANARVTKGEAEIMAACRTVARAVDTLEQQRFTAGETLARRSLERAADKLRTAMRKHNRFPTEAP